MNTTIVGRRRVSRAGVGVAAVAVLAGALGQMPSAQAATRTFASIDVTAAGQGYGLVSQAGEVYAYGAALFRGNPTGFSGSVVDVSFTENGQGYVAISSAGQVYAYGTAVPRGNPTGFSGSITGVSLTADGQGYVAVSSKGQVYAYGTAVPRGNPTGFSGSIVDISVTADGRGYVAISSTGQVYAYGTAVPRGNPTGFSGSIVDISVTADGQGYAAVSSAGQVYAYGTVAYRGNPTGFMNGIVGISVTADGQGYAVESGYGQVYAYGTVRHWGNGDPGLDSLDQMRSKIVAVANAQLNDSSHNRENPMGTDCNFYSTALGSGTAKSQCANGWRAAAWCADFARWTWKQSGARQDGLTAGAVSFKNYRFAGSWHAGSALTGIRPGDVIGYDLTDSSSSNDHVNVVVSVGGDGTITAVGGNQSNAVTRWTFKRGAASTSGKTISGYASPVA